MSEPCHLRQGEGYEACDDAGQGRCHTKHMEKGFADSRGRHFSLTHFDSWASTKG